MERLMSPGGKTSADHGSGSPGRRDGPSHGRPLGSRKRSRTNARRDAVAPRIPTYTCAQVPGGKTRALRRSGSPGRPEKSKDGTARGPRPMHRTVSPGGKAWVEDGP